MAAKIYGLIIEEDSEEFYIVNPKTGEMENLTVDQIHLAVKLLKATGHALYDAAGVEL